MIVAKRCELRAPERLLQLLDQFRGRMPCCEPRGQCLQRLTHCVNVAGFFKRDRVDDHAAVGRGADQTLGRKPAKRLSNGRAAYCQLLCQFHLEEAVPR